MSALRPNSSLGAIRPFWPVLLGCLLLVAEQGYFDLWPFVGVVAHWVLLVAMLYVAAMTADLDERAFCLALALVPISRLISTGLALELLGPFVEEAVIGIALLIGAWQVIRLQGLAREEVLIQATGQMRMIGPVVAVTSIILGIAGAWISGARMTVDVLSLPPALASVGVVLATAIAFVECLVFCGLILPATQRLVGRWPGLLFVAILWAGRYGMLPWTYMGLMLIQGSLLAWLTTRTRSMVYAVLADLLMILAFFSAAVVLG